LSEFERWESRYAGADYAFGKAPNYFLASCKGLLPKSGRVLAVADGEGRNGVWLAENGLDVVSIDFSPRALRKARALAVEHHVAVTFLQADVHTWDYPYASFDKTKLSITVCTAIFQFSHDALPSARRRIRGSTTAPMHCPSHRCNDESGGREPLASRTLGVREGSQPRSVRVVARPRGAANCPIRPPQLIAPSRRGWPRLLDRGDQSRSRFL
jgi:SAM-dependent methyltransferase